MAQISPNLPSDGEVASAASVNNPLNTIISEINGNLDSNNLANDAVTNSKLANTSVSTAKIQNESVTADKRSGGFKVGNFSISSTGNLSITGVGFKPKLVRFTFRTVASTSNALGGVGSMSEDGTQFATAWGSSSNGHASSSSTDACLRSIGTTSTSSTSLASFVSMDADGFTINVSAVSGTRDWAYEAFA